MTTRPRVSSVRSPSKALDNRELEVCHMHDIKIGFDCLPQAHAERNTPAKLEKMQQILAETLIAD